MEALNHCHPPQLVALPHWRDVHSTFSALVLVCVWHSHKSTNLEMPQGWAETLREVSCKLRDRSVTCSGCTLRDLPVGIQRISAIRRLSADPATAGRLAAIPEERGLG